MARHPRILLATLALNELEWLPRLWEQHRDWPGLCQWVFVESADQVYARCNPTMVTPEGTSKDGTSRFLDNLEDKWPDKVKVINKGICSDPDPAKGKCQARQLYMDIAEKVQPDYVIQVDADEFYTKQDQRRIVEVMETHKDYHSFIFPRREIWRPPTRADQPLFAQEVVGGFWGIPCCHWWRWSPGVHHRTCHNTLHTADGKPLNDPIFDVRTLRTAGEDVPEMIHMGFASKKETRLAKNEYYAERGERQDRKRAWYVKSRACWENWHPKLRLPEGAWVQEYKGPIPECFAGGAK